MQMAYHRLGPLKRHVLNTNVTIKNWWKVVLSDLGLAFHGFQLCLLFVLGVHDACVYVCVCGREQWGSIGILLVAVRHQRWAKAMGDERQ